MSIRYKIANQIGYRGLTLMTFGAMFMVLGVGVLANPMVDPNLWHTHLPIWFRMLIWSGAGATALVVAWRPQWQWLGFSALFVGPAERAMSFGAAMVMEPSLGRLTGTAIYLLLTLTVVLFASWPEPSRRTP